MKLTDLALVFIGVTLPIIIIVYVNVSFTIKSEEQEMYYKKIINIATKDAANQMKEVENVDQSIDYGYSGVQNSKVSINPIIAMNTFLDSLYNNFNIKGNTEAENYLKTFIPAIAIIDYDGVYIASQESNNEYVVKPKKYYSYTYGLDATGHIVNNIDGARSIHTIEFSMDDYITHRSNNNTSPKSFYLTDASNNSILFDDKSSVSNEVVKHLQKVKSDVIISTITDEITFAMNNANSYAKNAGISYNFIVPTFSDDEMQSAIEDIGIFGFMQGINIGNRYLNARAYSVSKLELTTKFYFSLYKKNNNDSDSKFKMNLYHNTNKCPEYQLAYHNGDTNNTKITPEYVQSKQQAASAIVVEGTKEVKYHGFYPCPVCNP